MSATNETRQRILAAALELFAERGFSATTTAALAQRAGVAEKTLFAQFKSKDRLFEETVSPAVLDLVAPQLTSSLVDTMDFPWERLEDFLRALFRNRVEFARLHRSKLKLIFQEVVLQPELFDRFFIRGQRDIFPRFAKLAKHLQAKGELRAMPAPTILRMIISTMVGYLVTRTILMPDHPWDDDVEVEMMATVLSAGLRPPPDATSSKSAKRKRAATTPGTRSLREAQNPMGVRSGPKPRTRKTHS